jgi:hypothetical protein
MNRMTVTSAQYIVNEYGENITINATIDGKGLIVPIDTANTDYQAIQEWIAEGNTIQEAD